MVEQPRKLPLAKNFGVRGWLWVRAPPNPEILFEAESPRRRYRSHSAGGSVQSNEQFHTVVCCYLLLFFWVTLADLTPLTAVWCTSPHFMTLLASSAKSPYAPQAGSVIRVNSRRCWMSRTGGSPKWRLY